MGESITCTSCGASNQLPEGKTTMFCAFCGSAIEKKVEPNGSFSKPEDNPQIKNFFELAKNAEESDNYEEAIKYYNKVLEFNPKISEAWFGKGYCSGWSGNLRTIKVNEMVKNFKKAIEYTLTEEQDVVRKKIANSIDGCAFAVYNLSYNHTIEFASVEKTYQEHLNRSIDVLDALEYAHSLNPTSKQILNSLVKISENLLTPISYKDYNDKYHTHNMDERSRLKVNNVRIKYSTQLALINPAYASEIEGKVQTGNVLFYIGIGGAILAFILFKTDNIFYCLVTGAISIFIGFIGYRNKSNYESVLEKIKDTKQDVSKNESKPSNSNSGLPKPTPISEVEREIKSNKKLYIVIATIIPLIIIIIIVIKLYSNKTNELNNNKPSPEEIALKMERIQDSVATITSAEIASKVQKNESHSDDILNSTKVISFIKSYYDDLSHNENYDANNWFTPYVSTYISKTDITPNDINNLHRSNTEFVNGQSVVDEQSFRFDRFENIVDRINGNENKISFWLFESNFSCYRTSKRKYQTCKVLVEIGLNDESNKIASYKEVKVNDLHFSVDKPEGTLVASAVEKPKVLTGEVFTIVQQMPTFNGGDAEKEKYLSDNIVYPTKEKEAGISGTCYLQFIVEVDGSLSNIQVLRSSGYEDLDKEALRMVTNMPKWVAGKQNGNNVRVLYNLPVKFKLR